MNVTQLRENFESIITSFVSLSEQARELETMKGTLNGMQNRLDELALTNTNLKTEITQAWDAVRSIERERDQAKAHNEALEQARQRDAQEREQMIASHHAQIAHAQDAIAARDQQIATLAAQVEGSNQANMLSSASLAQVQGENEVLRGRLGGVEHELDNLRMSYTEAQRVIAGNEDTIRDLSDKLDRVRQVFQTQLQAVA